MTVEKNYRMFVSSQLTDLEWCFRETLGQINSPRVQGLMGQYRDYNLESVYQAAVRNDL